MQNVNDDLSSFAASCTEFLSAIFTNQVLSHMSEMALNLAFYTKLKSNIKVIAEMQQILQILENGENFTDLTITVNKGKSNEYLSY